MASATRDRTAPEHVPRPPHAPWRPLKAGTEPHGYISTYLSDGLARYPVRAVTKPRDNKSDPNLETGTYGLFTTCQIRMRKSVVTRGVPLIFFVTTHRGARVLSGYYEVAWFAPGPDHDYALAASTWRFVAPIRADAITDPVHGAVRVRRGYRGLDAREAQLLRALIDAEPDLTAVYAQEAERLEQLSARHTGYRYPTWRRRDSWSWTDATTYLSEPDEPAEGPVPNTAPGDIWLCSTCSQRSISVARLKRCPHCEAVLTLRPQAEEQKS